MFQLCLQTFHFACNFACAIAVVKVCVLLLLLHMCCAVQVLVEHGTEVRTGDDLVIIEAMKVRQPEPVLVASCQISDGAHVVLCCACCRWRK